MPHATTAHRSPGTGAARRRLHRRRRRRLQDGGHRRPQRPARPAHPHCLEQLLRARRRDHHRRARERQAEVSVDDGQACPGQGRRGDRAGHQRWHPAGRGHLLHARQLGPVLPDPRLAGPQPQSAGRQDRQERHVAGGHLQLHPVPERPVRAADADRRLRPLLQRRPALQGRLQRAAEDHQRADHDGQEADRVQPGRQHQGGRLHAAVRLLREQREHARARLRRQVVRQLRQAVAQHRPQLDQDARVAEVPGRRHRLRQAAEVLRQARRRRLGVVGPARLRGRQDRHDDRRRVAQRLHRRRQVQGELPDGAVPGRRCPVRPLRRRAGRRDDHGHPQGRRAPGRVLAAGQVHDHRHQRPGHPGQGSAQRALDRRSSRSRTRS